FGDILDHHRFQTINPFVEKLSLPSDDRLTYLDYDVLALLNILQKLNGRFEAVLDVVLDVLIERIPLEHMPVGRTEPKLRNFVFVRDHGITIADFHDEHIG